MYSDLQNFPLCHTFSSGQKNHSLFHYYNDFLLHYFLKLNIFLLVCSNSSKIHLVYFVCSNIFDTNCHRSLLILSNFPLLNSNSTSIICSKIFVCLFVGSLLHCLVYSTFPHYHTDLIAFALK